MSESKKKKLAEFDPNQVGLVANQIFGLPFTQDESEVVLLPVPWDVTVSYAAGSRHGPHAIKEASYQIDLHDPDLVDGWQRGIAMCEISDEWSQRSAKLREKAEPYIAFLSEGGNPKLDPSMHAILDEINAACAELRAWVKSSTSILLESKKIVGIIGGDHSTPLGFLDALADHHSDFGILQFDAHCDLRDRYEGFKYSHASIMWNALTIPQISKLVQVGIRDFCKAESDVIESSKGRIKAYLDTNLKRELYSGRSWKELCQDIIGDLPNKVYISFDIDGLDPKLCPNTGTPVPGGLEFEQALFLMREVARSGRSIIGFDLNEVCPGENDEWDANVGARLLYKLCNLTMLSRAAEA